MQSQGRSSYQSFGWCHLKGGFDIRALVSAISREELVSEL